MTRPNDPTLALDPYPGELDCINDIESWLAQAIIDGGLS